MSWPVNTPSEAMPALLTNTSTSPTCSIKSETQAGSVRSAANPTASGVPQEARLLRQAVDAAVASGGLPAMSTASLTDAVLAALDRLVLCGGSA